MTRVTNRWALILAAVCGYAGLSGCDSPTNVPNNDFEVTEAFSFDVTVENQQAFTVAGINGSISVTGVNGATTIQIDGTRRVRSDSEQDARGHLQDLEVRITGSADEVAVRTEQPEQTQGREYQIDYIITVPSNFDVTVTNVNGGIVVDALRATVSVANINGEIVLTNIEGNTTVDVVNGAIDAQVTLPSGGVIDFGTVNGQIELDVPVNTSANFAATVANGTTSLTGLVLDNQVSTNTSLTGRLGSGNGTIELHTVNGSIRVTGS